MAGEGRVEVELLEVEAAIAPPSSGGRISSPSRSISVSGRPWGST